jgi:4-hydroxybenzoate polyprenyltransferase
MTRRVTGPGKPTTKPTTQAVLACCIGVPFVLWLILGVLHSIAVALLVTGVIVAALYLYANKGQSPR